MRTSIKAEALGFSLLVLVQAASVWLFRAFLTQDGAAHFENAVALVNISSAPYARFYEPNPQLQANWPSHLLIAALSRWMTGPDVDRVMATVCLLAVPVGFRYALTRMVPRAPRSISWAGIPFAASATLYWGFWNYSLALSAFFVVLAELWSFRGRKGISRPARYSATLLLLGFCHPLALAELGVIALWILCYQFALAARRRGTIVLMALGRRLLRLCSWSIPAAALFVTGMDRRHGSWQWESFPKRLIKLATLHPLAVFQWHELAISVAIGAGISTVVLAIVAVRRARLDTRWDSLLVGAGGAALVALIAPETASGGGDIGVRAVLFPFLLALLWIGAQAARWPSLSRIGPAVATAGILLIVIRLPAQERFNMYLAEYRSAARWIPDGSLVVPIAAFGHIGDMTQTRRSWILRVRDRVLRYDPESPRRRIAYAVDPLLHAIGYDAAERHLIDAGNYEVLTGYFPVIARDVVSADLEVLLKAIEANSSPCVPLDLGRARVDAVLLFGDLDPCEVMARVLRQHFRLAFVSATGMAKTYLRATE